MLEHQERELTPYEIADISYDLSVRCVISSPTNARLTTSA